jgi:hypothetical protein
LSDCTLLPSILGTELMAHDIKLGFPPGAAERCSVPRKTVPRQFQTLGMRHTTAALSTGMAGNGPFRASELCVGASSLLQTSSPRALASTLRPSSLTPSMFLATFILPVPSSTLAYSRLPTQGDLLVHDADFYSLHRVDYGRTALGTSNTRPLSDAIPILSRSSLR